MENYEFMRNIEKGMYGQIFLNIIIIKKRIKTRLLKE